MRTNIFDLTGQKAMVIGGSSGISHQFAKALANAGADVSLCCRRQDRCAENAKEIEELYGVKATYHYLDLRDFDSITKAVEDVLADFGRIDILCNAAGIAGGGDPCTVGADYWKDVIQVDLTGQCFVASEVVRLAMKPQQYGRIIMVSSIHGIASRKGADTSAYAAAKGGIVQITRSFCNSWARDGITVNCICPGYFPTELTAAYIDTPAFHQQHMEVCPMERHGNIEEMDGACVFFASPCCSYTTGQVIACDGGWSAI